jgi:hypothetical protein
VLHRHLLRLSRALCRQYFYRESEAMKPDAYGGRQGIAHAIEPVAITISAGSAASTDL